MGHFRFLLSLGLAFTLARCANPTSDDPVPPTRPSGEEPSSDLELAAAAQEKPNIVVFEMDDFDMASFQSLRNARKIPNIQAMLLDQGVEFTNSFVTNAVCAPSRATLLTGQYTKNHGLRDLAIGIRYWMTGPKAGMEANTLAPWMQQAGYRTAHVGKYLNGYGVLTSDRYVPPGYSEWYGLVDPTTYNMYNYKLNTNGQVVTYGSAAADYQTDRLAQTATQFLANHGSRYPNQPFFMVLAPVAPHIEVSDTPTDASRGYLNHFQDTIRPAPRHVSAVSTMPMPVSLNKASFNEADVSDKSPYGQSLPLLDSRARTDVINQWKARLASVLAVDDMVGQVMNTLSQQGKLEKTVFIFTSDNGYHFGEHRLSSKLTPYDEAARVPLIVRGPGFGKGVQNTSLILNTDLAPTIVELGRATAGLTMDGRSFRIQLQNPTTVGTRKQFLQEHFIDVYGLGTVSAEDRTSTAASAQFPTFRGVRRPTGNTTYVQWYANLDSRGTGAVQFREFYNLAADPFAIQNVAASMSSTQQQQFSRLVSEFQSCVGVSCQTAENK